MSLGISSLKKKISRELSLEYTLMHGIHPSRDSAFLFHQIFLHTIYILWGTRVIQTINTNTMHAHTYFLHACGNGSLNALSPRIHSHSFLLSPHSHSFLFSLHPLSSRASGFRPRAQYNSKLYRPSSCILSMTS